MYKLPDNLLKHHELSDWAILLGYRGSIAHGMYIPNSDPNSIDDKDVMGVCIPPIEYYWGLKEFGSRGTKEIKQGEWDIVIYEVKKFIRLLRKGNPNALIMLWLEPEHYIYVSDVGKYIIENGDTFVGKHIYHSFVGYAMGQLKRMTHIKFEGYMGEKRKRLVEKFGFDCKNASHLIRLLRMCAEFLVDGRFYAHRTKDSEELLAIKRGEWTLDKVMMEANQLFKECETLYSQSTLPESPDDEAINKLCVKLLKMHFANIGY